MHAKMHKVIIDILSHVIFIHKLSETSVIRNVETIVDQSQKKDLLLLNN